MTCKLLKSSFLIIFFLNSRRVKNIRDKVDNVCTILQTFCDNLLESYGESIDQNLSMKESSALLLGLKTLFQESSDIEQMRLLTISPDSWDRRTIQNFYK